ncbi:MAG: sugar ABC transporter substrate-binding protein [Chloroflexi bacterium]|nr:MAG: sugar ABC transporter substrate-binding protein [Chloroflexota bacterium]
MEAVSLRYSLWDANQLPPYEQCAADFMAANPNIEIVIEQQGWGDYWDGIQTGMVAGNAPDVFTNHLAKYPEFAAKEQLIDIQPFVEADGVDMGMYLEGLADLWARDEARYGLPKDWDTIAVVYNKEMLDAAGVTVEELNEATWNPQDGGTFEEIIAKLTLDENGNNGLSPDFDKDNVEQYGYIPLTYNDAGGAYGQTQWSHFAVSNGWAFNDGLYDTKYYYDDAKFIETIDWMQNIIVDKGYAPPYPDIVSLGGNAIFTSGGGAVAHDGSWMIGTYTGNSNFEVGFARLPIGPEGRKSMFNGLADSIWVGTEHVDEAWLWLKYLASPECANVVGEAGVVFPAQEEAVNKALAAFGEKGLDVAAFTEQALEENGTFLFPVTDNASEITNIMAETMDNIFLGEVEPADILPEANEEVNGTFK